MTNNMRRGFTMIELVFVIVIIGILAAVAIPKLAQNRDDATAAVCATDIGNILSAATTTYAKDGYSKFQNVAIEDVFNGNIAAAAGKSGVTDAAGTKIATGIHYQCEGGPVVAITFAPSTTDASIYEMKIDTSGASTTVPAAIKAAKIVEENQHLDPTTHTKTVAL